MNAALAISLFAVLHSRSEGRSDFTLDETGRVAIKIQIGLLDLPELCNVDFSAADREREEQKLDMCLHRNFPRWLRIRGDAPCPVLFDAWSQKSATIELLGSARCPSTPRVLVIDWGLFAGSPLDHVSIATVRQPYADPRLALLSKRASKLTIEVARPRWPFAFAFGAAGVVVLVALVAAVRRALRGRMGVYERRPETERS